LKILPPDYDSSAQMDFGPSCGIKGSRMRIRKTRAERCLVALYKKFVEQLIRDSRREAGWEVPWFVAQASYHGPEDTGSADIRAAQRSLWSSGIALEGPDTDALMRDLRTRQEKACISAAKGCASTGRAGLKRFRPGWTGNSQR